MLSSSIQIKKELEEVEDEEDEEEEEETASSPRPPVLDSIQHLQTLHSALSAFFLHYNSLDQTLNSIHSALTASKSTPIKQEVVELHHDDSNNNNNNKDEEESEDPQGLAAICKAMDSEALLSHVSSNLHDRPRLSCDVPEALKLAPNPPKLVLDSLGQFGRDHFESPDADAVRLCRSCTLLLELYLLAFPLAAAPGPPLREEAAAVAVGWMDRMVREGGIEKAAAPDALSLVLFLACFGVPVEIGTEDLYTLLRRTNLKKKADVFCLSSVLLDKMPHIINDLKMKNMQVEAADLICDLGLGEKFPVLPMLTSFVQKTCEFEAKEKTEDPLSLIEAYELKLLALESVEKFVEENKVDAPELSSLRMGRRINRFIKRFQSENKRKLEEIEPSSDPEPGAKHPSYSSTDASCVPGIGLRTESVHGAASGWNGSGQLRQSLLGTLYVPGNNFSQRPSASPSFYQPPVSSGNSYPGQLIAAGQSFYRPPPLPHPSVNLAGQSFYHPPASFRVAEEMESGKNLYQFADMVSQNKLYYYGKPATSDVVPAAPHAGPHAPAEYAGAYFGGLPFKR